MLIACASLPRSGWRVAMYERDGMSRAVIFDLDGVLIDSTEAHYRAWQGVCRDLGFALEWELFLKTVGTSNDVTVRTIFGEDVLPERSVELANDKEIRYRREVKTGMVVIDGAVDLVERLHKAGWLLALGTSAPLGNVECVMEAFPAAALLPVKVNADMVSTGKPAPFLFLKAAEVLGVEPAACVVIEDSLAGLEAARRAGMASVGLTTTMTRAELAGYASAVVDSLRDVTPEMLDAILDKKVG